MKFTFLGTGGAFDIEFGNSAALVEFKTHTILLDCGFTVYPVLRANQLTRGIQYILLTHLHNDHTGSLANILLHCHFFNTNCRPAILYPDDDFRDEIYEFLRLQLQKPEKYVDFVPLSELPGITAVDTFGQHADNLQTYAYIFEENGQRIAYSGDMGQPEAFYAYLRGMPPKPTTVFQDITFDEANSAHTYYKRLIPLANGYELFGYHCNPGKSPEDNPFPLVQQQPSLMLPGLVEETARLS
ncbi:MULTISPECIES: MBL fold metallo-hydrolase [Rufibacter]|uniref:Ribonuclease BN (tRNA processing enzyme) n=1 Tax=Rufibacter quisquiliarum TaxID=1549639 RepID=A0A839GF99_9BACT|nr:MULTISPECIES: MBL fold metallo-hydrolase [Rufibacter]MBA9075349.1 ribonuclease BN (tRNA processing enzyme) [Rufibacter quisquiliarum]